MGIQSIALPGENDSPFYLNNKAFCEDFESFITDLGGQTTGSYNASSYNVKGRVDAPLRWIFQLKKSTYYSGYLFVSTKKQSLQFWTIWKCKNLETDFPNFRVRKKRFGDSSRILISPSVCKFQNRRKYTIISSQPNHALANRLSSMLKFYLSDQSLLKMTYVDNELIIQVSTEQILKNKFKELMNEKFRFS